MNDGEADTVRFGLVGTGYWAREVHAAGIAAHPDAELVGVWGRDAAKANALAAAYEAVTVFATADEMFEAVDAVAFSVPPQVQADLAVRAAAAGCHLLLEKPLAIGISAADAVVEAVERARVASVVFFTDRFVPQSEQWLSDAAAGEMLGGEAVWLASLQTPGNPFADSPWRKAEGALWDVGPHALASLLPVLGPVTEVTGVRGPGDLVELALRHESGAASRIALSLTMPPDASRHAVEFYDATGWRSRPVVEFAPVDAHRNAVGELIETVAAGDTGHRCDARFARDVVAVLDRARRSLLPQ